MENKKIKDKHKKIEDIIFLFILVLIMIVGLVKPYINPRSINYNENRAAYGIPILYIEHFLDKTYQDNYENALSDQIPFSNKMKIAEKTFELTLKKYYYSNINYNYYTNLGNDIYLIDNNLVYKSYNLEENQEKLDSRIKNINEVVNKIKNVNFYAYYIERDIDIDFTENKKALIYEYLKERLNSRVKISKFEINNFDEYKNYFYQTDHHWNHKGSYKGYLDVIELLGLDDKKYDYDEVCLNSKMSGSKSKSIGGQNYFIEDFCAYKFDLPEHQVYINTNFSNSYGNYDELIKTQPKRVEYGEYYGWDNGLIKFDYNKSYKDNLLIIGESYDNAINELIASYFNKTYNIDLRNYEKQMGKKFNIFEFIEENDIDKVLFIGNGDFYMDIDFYLEVIE